MSHPTKPHTLSIGGHTLDVKYTIDAMMEIERELKTSVLKVVQNLSDGELSIETMLIILKHGLRGADNSLPPNKIKEIVGSDYVGAISGVSEAIAVALGVKGKDADADAASEATGEAGESIG